MDVILTEQEKRNREILGQIGGLLKGFISEVGANEAVFIGALTKSPKPEGENTMDLFSAVLGRQQDLEKVFYNFLKNDPKAYTALRGAMLRLTEEKNPAIVKAVNKIKLPGQS